MKKRLSERVPLVQTSIHKYKRIVQIRTMDPMVLIMTIAALACASAAPDTTTLVTLEVQSPGDNDSVSHVQVRIRFYFQCGLYFCFYPYFISYPRFCFYFFSKLILSLMDFVSGTGSWKDTTFNIFSRVRSHFFPAIGSHQSNYARICCFFRVISTSSRIRSHLNARIPISSWIRSNFNLFSAYLGAAPDTTTLVTLEVQSPGGNDSVSLVQVRCSLIVFIFFNYNFNFNSTIIIIFIYFIYLLIRNRTFSNKLIFNSIFTCIFIDFNYLFIRNRTFSIKLVFNSIFNSVFIFIFIHFIYLFIRNLTFIIK